MRLCKSTHGKVHRENRIDQSTANQKSIQAVNDWVQIIDLNWFCYLILPVTVKIKFKQGPVGQAGGTICLKFKVTVVPILSSLSTFSQAS